MSRSIKSLEEKIRKSRSGLVVGLTGGFASGKSTVARMFARRGAEVLDSDQVVHRLLTQGGACSAAVRKFFGPEVFSGTALDKAKLAKVVFQDEQKRQALERLIHPAVSDKINRRIAQFRKRRRPGVLIVEVPLLFEVGWERRMDRVVVVRARRADQLARALRGRFKDRGEVLRRIKTQMPLGEKVKRGDVVIDNSGTRRQTQRQVGAAWAEFQAWLKVGQS